MKPTVGEQINRFLEQAQHHRLPVKTIKLSRTEFAALLNDPDARDRYSDGHYRDIPLVIAERDVWTI